MSTENKTISEEYINSFLDDSYKDEIDSQESKEEQRSVMLGVVEETVSFFYSSFDEKMKEKGAVGLGVIPAEKLTQLTMIVAKEDIPDDWLTKAPRMALGTALASIGIANLASIRRLNLNKKNDKDV